MGSHAPSALTDEQIRELAEQLVTYRAVILEEVPEDVQAMVFLPLTLMDWPAWLPQELATMTAVGLLGLHETAGHSINGYPIFMECRFLHRADLHRAVVLAQHVLDARDEALAQVRAMPIPDAR